MTGYGRKRRFGLRRREVRFAGGLHRSEERASSWEDVFTELRGNALRDLKGYDADAGELRPRAYIAVGLSRGDHQSRQSLLRKRHVEALASYGSALTLRPDHVDALNNCVIPCVS